MNNRSRRFGNAINRLIAGESLSRRETQELFSEVLSGTQSEMHQGAFLSAITAKGPSPQEIAGVWQAIYELDTVKVSPRIRSPLLENSGTGMDRFKTFNISTAAAIVGSAGGVVMARHGSRAITSCSGTVDLCEELGVDVECGAETVQMCIEKTGIGLFNGMSPHVHPKSLFRILSQISFGSILNVAASLANPANPVYGVRGVYARNMVVPVIETMKEIGFKRAMVFHGKVGNGEDGIDEISPVAETIVSEFFEAGETVTYTLSPFHFGPQFPVAREEIAAAGDAHKEALRLLRVLTGKDKGGLYETICLNSAPIFYVAGETRTLKEGFERARDIIDSGRALDKLGRWVEVQNRAPSNGKRLGALLAQVQESGSQKGPRRGEGREAYESHSC